MENWRVFKIVEKRDSWREPYTEQDNRGTIVVERSDSRREDVAAAFKVLDAGEQALEVPNP